MVNFLLQENIDDLQKLSDRLLHISDEMGIYTLMTFQNYIKQFTKKS